LLKLDLDELSWENSFETGGLNSNTTILSMTNRNMGDAATKEDDDGDITYEDNANIGEHRYSVFNAFKLFKRVG